MKPRLILCTLVAAAVFSFAFSTNGFAQDRGAQTKSVYRVGGGVTAPKIVKRVLPEFSAEARAKKIEGLVMLSAVIDEDGLPSNIHLISPALGYGLDEKAVEAFRQWRFEPGTKDGHAVRVQINCEMSFHRY